MMAKSPTFIDLDIEYRKLEKKLANLGGWGAANAMQAAAPAAMSVISKENARLVKTTQWRTRQRKKKAFRKRAGQKGGYVYIDKARAGTVSAKAGYNYKHPEMRIGHFAEDGNGGEFKGWKHRRTAFFKKRKRAQFRMVKALAAAIEIASKHPKGKVSKKAVKAVVGPGWGKRQRG